MSMTSLCRMALWLAFSITLPLRLPAQDAIVLPDTQAPEFSDIVSNYHTALAEAKGKSLSSMTKHIQRYLDEAGEMLKEKRKSQNTTGIAIATTASSIFTSALSNLNTTGTFEIPQKVRRELENTMTEFSSGRALIDSYTTKEQARIFKQFSDVFAAQCQKHSPALTSPEARVKMDERFLAMSKAALAPTAKTAVAGASPGTPAPNDSGTNTPAGAALSPIMAESGESPTWIPVGKLTANIRNMEVLEIPLAGMRLGTNSIMKNSAMSDSTIEIIFVATATNFTHRGAHYRLMRIPKFNDVSIMDWPTDSNSYYLNLRTPSPEWIPFPIGFELHVSSLPESVNKPAQPPQRKIALTVQSTPPRATIYIDGVRQPDTVTPCTLQIPVGPHDFRLSLDGYLDLNVTNYNFTVNREIKWTFKPVTARPASKPKK